MQPDYSYYLCGVTFQNGIQMSFPPTKPDDVGPGSAHDCSPLLREANSTTPSSGDGWWKPDTGMLDTGYTEIAVLQDGATYKVCFGEYHREMGKWIYLLPTVANCAVSTIDRDRPSIGVSIDDTTEVTNNAIFHLQIDYSDPTSPPWFGSDGRASN